MKNLATIDRLKFCTNANTDGIGNCLQQPGQLSNQLHKSMRSTLHPLIIIFGTVTTPAAETKSVGL